MRRKMEGTWSSILLSRTSQDLGNVKKLQESSSLTIFDHSVTKLLMRDDTTKSKTFKLNGNRIIKYTYNKFI